MTDPPFLFVRHGETESNRDGLLAGSTDVQLTETGLCEAATAAEALSQRDIRCICSSPLRRARDTAAIIAARLHLPVSPVPELAERNWGELEGSRLPIDLAQPSVPGGETLAAFNARVARGVATARSIAAGRPLLIVAHAGVFRALCDLYRIPVSSAWIENARPVLFPGSPQRGRTFDPANCGR